MAQVRVYVKRQLRLDLLSADQRTMFQLGNVALAARKDDISKAQNSRNAAAKPLRRGYAIKKTRLGKGNRRNLSFSGDMLRNWSVRTVSSNRVVALWTTKKNREKARANNKIEKFIDFSPRNEAIITTAAERIIIIERMPRMVFEKTLSG